MRRLIEKLGVVRVGFICVFAMMFICTLCIVSAIESLENTIRETNESSTPTISMSYEEPEEVIVPVYFDNEEYNYNGNMIYTFGDISDEFYFNILINEEQGLYVYCFRDMRIEYESLAELQESVMCHIDQECPNATFVMRNN